jgi:hypothetical protein
MRIDIDHAWQARAGSGRTPTVRDVYDAVIEGGAP